MNESSKIFIVGHGDIMEKSLTGYFQGQGFKNVYSSSQMVLNTAIQPSVYRFFQEQRPEYVFLGSTRSGGIQANQEQPAEFFYHNSETQNNVVYAAHKFGVKKLVYFASSCVYPKECVQPMPEDKIGTGLMEPTSEAYSTAKLAGIRLVQSFRRQYGLNAITVIPATVYGPDCDVDLKTAHVMGALIAKFSDAVRANASQVAVWGTGTPRREFLYKDDFIRAVLFLTQKYESEEPVNIGAGEDISIKELVLMIAQTAGFAGNIIMDETKPDGVMRKFLDNSRITRLGFKPRVGLQEGIKKTYQWYMNK